MGIQYSYLTDNGLICVQGAEATSFLQGQLTCNMATLQPQHVQLAGYCNRQGRLHAIMLVYCLSDSDGRLTYLLQLPHDIIEQSLQQLTQYAAFSNVNITNVSDQWHSIGIIDSEESTLTMSNQLSFPSSLNACHITDAYIVAKVAENTSRYCLLCRDKTNPIIAWLSQHATCVEQNIWHCENIRAGIAYIHADTIEAFTPHQVNLQLVDGVSFDKGCYLGQEVVARMHHLGKLKQHAYYAISTTQDELVITPGDPIVSQAQKIVGHVINSSYLNNSYHLLISVQDVATEQTLTLKKAPTITLELKELPYHW